MKNFGKIYIYLLPAVLLITMYGAFYLLTAQFGKLAGYFYGFVFYWFFWCLATPLALIGKKQLIGLLKMRKPVFNGPAISNITLLVLPLIAVYWYEFPKAISQANLVIILASAVLSIVNGFLEELLWRGTFLKVMGGNPKWYIVYSSLGFACWHFAPLSVFSNHNPGGTLSFVAVSFIFGLLYSVVAKNSQSILFIAASHILFDFSGLGARIYF